jgi:hypothetical protein
MWDRSSRILSRFKFTRSSIDDSMGGNSTNLCEAPSAITLKRAKEWSISLCQRKLKCTPDCLHIHG